MNEYEFTELAAGHALHALSAEDEAAYLEALSSHPEWAPIADEDEETAAVLADGAPLVAPPAALRDAVLADIASSPQQSAESTDPSDGIGQDVSSSLATGEKSARPKRRRVMFALAACLVVVAGIGIGSVAVHNQLNQPASVVALNEIEASTDAARASVPLGEDGSATVHWSAEAGAAVLVADGLESPGADQTYELWFIRGETPTSAGTFDPETGETVVQLDGEMHAGDVVAVTVEPSGGSSTGLPTSDPIFAIPTA